MDFKYLGPNTTLFLGQEAKKNANGGEVDIPKTRQLVTGKTYDDLPEDNDQVKVMKAKGLLEACGNAEASSEAVPEEGAASANAKTGGSNERGQSTIKPTATSTKKQPGKEVEGPNKA